MDFCGKNIVITDATSGIGLALLNYFMQRGDCGVCAVGRNEAKLQKLKERYGSRVFCIKCDLSKKEETDLMFEKLFTKRANWKGSTDIFIANAGFGYYEKIETADWGHIDNIFTVNCYSPIYSLLKMREYKRGKDFQFVIVASGVAKAPLPGYSLYSATKSSVDAFAKAFFNEKDKNITLSVVYPVAVKTPFYDKSRNTMKAPLMQQNMESNIRNIISGIYSDRKYIYPSVAFKLYLLLRNFLPITAVYVFIERLRFKMWLRKQP